MAGFTTVTQEETDLSLEDRKYNEYRRFIENQHYRQLSEEQEKSRKSSDLRIIALLAFALGGLNVMGISSVFSKSASSPQDVQNEYHSTPSRNP